MRQERLLKYKQTARQYQSSRYETLDSDLINAIFIHRHIVYGHTIQMYIVERGRNKDKRQ